MTGELHHLLMTQSLIGKGLPAQQPDDAAFERGLEKGLAQPSLISELFVAVAARVLGGLAASSVSDYLSGLLIGAEVATGAAFLYFCRHAGWRTGAECPLRSGDEGARNDG